MVYVTDREIWSCSMGRSIVDCGRATSHMGKGIIPFPLQTIITLVRGSSLMWSCATPCDCHVMMPVVLVMCHVIVMCYPVVSCDIVMYIVVVLS